LPLLAEAAPDAFLDAIERGLSEPSLLSGLFVDADGVFAHSPHTELLWALEVLAWSPLHIGRAALAVARLAKIDPGGRLVNRPAKSLREIFLSWHPSTRANVAQRIAAIDLLRRREPSASWNLMAALLPRHMDVAMPTVKPRRRDWLREENVTMGEAFRFTGEILRRMREDVGYDGDRWTQLIPALDDLPDDEFKVTTDLLQGLDLSKLPIHARVTIWNRLREEISRHRKYHAADWAMADERIGVVDALYAHFEPDDPVARISWLFENRVALPDGGSDDWQVEMQKVEDLRLAGVEALLKARGREASFDMAEGVARPFDVGVALGRSALSDEDLLCLLSDARASSVPWRRNAALGVLRGRDLRVPGWLDTLPLTEIWQTWTVQKRADVFLARPFAPSTWDALGDPDSEVRRLYWTQVGYRGKGPINASDRATAVRELARYGQLADAIGLLTLYSRERIDAAQGAEVLEGVMRGECSQDVNWGSFAYELGLLIDAVEASGEIEEGRLARLEWFFQPVLQEQRPAKLLNKALANDPAFFIDILKLMYRGEGEDQTPVTSETRGLAERAYRLLHEWKVLPGTFSDGLDQASLMAWVRQARTLAAQARRGGVCDYHIGKLFSRSPIGTDGLWPHEAVRDVIEEVSSEGIEGGIGTGVYNSRGVVSRAIGEGGILERELVAKYRGYAFAMAQSWPRTARVLRSIADDYEFDSQREDERAELEDELWR
jgi:hypothetical protein